MKKMLFVYNPRAGKGQIRQKLADILDLFTEGGYEITIVPTRKHGDAGEIVGRRGTEFDMVVCCGGDGTLDETVTGLTENGLTTPIGYIPAGSTNDYGASLALPKDMTLAAERIVRGKDLAVDIGSFNEDVFVYIAAFGAFTEVSYRADQNMKNMLGYSAYILEGAKSIPDIRPIHVKVDSGRRHYDENFLYGMVTNATSVGGFKGIAGSDVELSDGKFEVTLVREPRNLYDMERLLNAFMTRNFEDKEEIIHFSTKHVTFTFDEETPWTLDGEDGGAHSIAEIAVRPKAVTIRV